MPTDKGLASEPSPPPLTHDTLSSTSSHPQSVPSTSLKPKEAREQPQHANPTTVPKPVQTAESDPSFPGSSMINKQRQRWDAAPTRPRNESEKPPAPLITPEGCEGSGPATLDSGLDAPTQDSGSPKNPGSNDTSADVPTAQSNEPHRPSQDETDEIDVDDDPPSETDTDKTNHLPRERFASKKSLDGLDYVPALFTPEEEDTLLTLFETLQPMWDTSMNRHLKHYGYSMGANGSHVQRTTDVPAEYEPYIERMVKQLASRGISLEVPNQVTLARYDSGAGVGEHMDAELLEKYVPDLNLKCPVPMHLQHVKGGHHYVHWMDLGLVTCLRGEA